MVTTHICGTINLTNIFITSLGIASLLTESTCVQKVLFFFKNLDFILLITAAVKTLTSVTQSRRRINI